MTPTQTSASSANPMTSGSTLKSRASIVQAGRIAALAGVVLPLLLIGILKFTRIEIEALKPLIGGTPWLTRLYPALGEAGASYLLGVVETATALMLIASPWSRRAGVAGGGARDTDLLPDDHDVVRVTDLGGRVADSTLKAQTVQR